MRGLGLIVLLLLTVVAERTRERLQKEDRIERQSQVRTTLPNKHRIRLWMATLGTLVVGFATIVGTILEVDGLFLGVSPEFNPSADPKTYTAPIVIRNVSSTFSMLNVQPDCLITHVEFAPDPTQPGISIGGSDASLEHAAGRLDENPFPKTNIGPNSPLNYSCDAMPNGIPEDPATGQPKPELVTKITFIIQLDYDVWFPIYGFHQHRFSQPITWQKTGDSGRWQNGANLDDVNTPAGPQIPGIPKGPVKMGPFRY